MQGQFEFEWNMELISYPTCACAKDVCFFFFLQSSASENVYRANWESVSELHICEARQPIHQNSRIVERGSR